MRTPGSAPTAVQEFCGKGVKAGSTGGHQRSDVRAAGFVLVVVVGEPVIIADAQKAGSELQACVSAGGTGRYGGAGIFR
jgi:hypothetical protein